VAGANRLERKASSKQYSAGSCGIELIRVYECD